MKEKDDIIDQLTKKMKSKDEEIANYLNKVTKLEDYNELDKKYKLNVDNKNN
jgi:hypothetical protein